MINLNGLSDTDIILSTLDIAEGRYSFMERCSTTGCVYAYSVPFNQIGVRNNNDKGLVIVYCTVSCQCGNMHSYFLWKNF